MALRRSNAHESLGFDLPLTNPRENVSQGLYDERKKVSSSIKIGQTWNVKMTTLNSCFEMEKLNMLHVMKARYNNLKSLNNPEIHIIWKPYIPNYQRDWKLSVGLEWTPGNSDLQCAVLPLHMHAHMIFYPNHAAPISSKEPLPWKLNFSVENAEIKEGTTIADMWIELHGYVGETAAYGGHNDAKIISLVPIDEPFLGVTFSRPYIYDTPWKISGFTLLPKHKTEGAKLILLQQLGIDLQGLRMGKCMKKVLGVINNSDLKGSHDEDSRNHLINRIRNVLLT
uniref:Protein 3 n=1 Tax=Brassica virus 2_Jun TaxID=2977959 RepID=A0A9N6YJB3_9RHAB|nr:TPA_asm: protein 3 [Brassica virus 2_Jun]